MTNAINMEAMELGDLEVFKKDETQRSNLKAQNNSQIANPKSQRRDKPFDIRERILIFTHRVLHICKLLPKIPECEAIRKQLACSCTSIGANYEEADGALTKKDFINKAGISRKEAKETRFWLRVISKTYINVNETVNEIKESEEIINILSAILIRSGARTWR